MGLADGMAWERDNPPSKTKPVLIALYSSDMRSGKSTVASMLTKRLFGVTHSFADPLYQCVISIAAPFFPEGEAELRRWLADDRKDNQVIPGLGVTLRFMLQTLGTKWGRDLINYDLWTLLAEKKAQKALEANSYSVIFDDMRFPNEFDMVKRNGGRCVRILRHGVGSRGDTRIGEGLLDQHNFDAYVFNNGTLDELRLNVWNTADYLESMN